MPWLTWRDAAQFRQVAKAAERAVRLDFLAGSGTFADWREVAVDLAVAWEVHSFARSELRGANGGGSTIITPSSVTRHGITWTFDDEYQVGNYVNGDPYVVGPVTILEVDPPWTPDYLSQKMNRVISVHGSQSDPLWETQAYTTHAPQFDESLRVQFPVTLDADDGPVAYTSHQQPVELVDAREVPGAYGGHLDDLPLYELDPVVLVQYPGLAHAVVVVDGEAPPYNLLRHRSPPVVSPRLIEEYTRGTRFPFLTRPSPPRARLANPA
jgi:hypothetical protein